MGDENMSILTSAASGDQISHDSSSSRNETPTTATSLYSQLYSSDSTNQPPPPSKKKRSLPGNPDPEAEVVALSPKTLLATNRFFCEICNKGFKRDQNLQLHRRGHNLPWKLKQRTGKEVRRKVYVCPEPTCVHHHPSRALGDLTGIKKHFCRKHGEKKWKCEKCSKKYAVQSDWKAHSKICGTREYKCDCGTIFSRRDSFITHRAFCDALSQENVKSTTPSSNPLFPFPQSQLPNQNHYPFPLKTEQIFNSTPQIPPWLPTQHPLTLHQSTSASVPSLFSTSLSQSPLFTLQNPNPNSTTSPSHMSATALLQKAARMGSTMSSPSPSPLIGSHQGHHLLYGNGNIGLCSGQITTSSMGGSGWDLCSREEMGDGLAAFGNKAESVTSEQQAAESLSAAGRSSDLLLHDMMVSLSSGDHGFHESSFEEAINGILRQRKDPNHGVEISPEDKVEVTDFGSNGGGGGRNDVGLTRDFLGLRAFTNGNFFNITAGLGQQNLNQMPWRD